MYALHARMIFATSRVLRSVISKRNAVTKVLGPPIFFHTARTAKMALGVATPAQKSFDDTPRFTDFYSQLASDVVADVKNTGLPDDAVQWVQKMMDYTVPGGKMNRGLSVIGTLRELIKDRELTEKEVNGAYVIGWCIEWLQAFFLVADDIMDGSKTRRGQPCWYMQEKVGLIAINDSFILESCIYRLLKKHLRQEPYYLDLLELFHETTWQTELGQLMDLTTAPEGDVDLNRFSLEKYKLIVKYKTAFYSFYLPVASAMLMAGFNDEKGFAKAKEILLIIGEYFQIQDDYLDCFGDPAHIGKIGTDIEDNKCSWLINQALLRANEHQRKALEQNYGQKQPLKVNTIKQIYRDLRLPEVFNEYEESSFATITKLVGQLEREQSEAYAHGAKQILPAEVFLKFAKRIYKRSK